MDATGLAITLLHEIYNIAAFINQVYTSTKNYTADKDTLSFTLTHELEILRLFDRILFDPAHGITADPRLAVHLSVHSAHITAIILRLRSTLEIYRSVSSDYFHDDAPADPTTTLRARLSDLKKKSWSWSLFDKDRLTEIVASFRETTNRLKEIYTLIMLDATRVRDSPSSTSPSPSTPNIQQIQSLSPSLASGLKRQELAWKVDTKQDIDALEPLQGHINPAPTLIPGEWGAQKVWTYSPQDDDSPRSTVTVEYKRYRPVDTLSVDLLPEQKAFMALIRGRIQALATILGSDATLHTFKALGYIDEPHHGRFALLFEIPGDAAKAPGPVALDSFLERGGEIQLQERFYVAGCLGETLFALHSSGWLHKNVCSRQVVLVRVGGGGWRVRPFLTGFEYSRPSDERTDGGGDYDVRRNIYRHPKRQGYPREDFRPIHDLFAFGVLLLEIGVRKTMVTYFAKKIGELEKRGELGEPEWFSREMVRLAEKKLGETMGGRYRDAVVACLKGEFGIAPGDMSRSRLAMAFRDRVLAVLKAGMEL